MLILGIESSCDDTGIAILEVKGSKKNPDFKIFANLVSSQAQYHAQFGGVFPAMAKREHTKNIFPLFTKALAKAKILKKSTVELSSFKKKKIEKILEREPELLEVFLKEIPNIKKPKFDRIAVTVGPGLEPTLWVGINFARALSLAWNIPLVPTNHMEGHALSVMIKQQNKFKLPALSLLVSGGHTELVLVNAIGKYKILGATRDDAAGEAFDKVARMLGLRYPGGPEISKLANEARSLPKQNSLQRSGFVFPRPMIHSKDFDFSFSGLKTAVLYTLLDLGSITELQKKAIAKEFEDAVVEVLVSKTMKATEKYKVRSICVGGGVAANKHLQLELTKKAKEIGLNVIFPKKELIADNALMIALAGYFGKPKPISSPLFKANGNLQIG